MRFSLWIIFPEHSFFRSTFICTVHNLETSYPHSEISAEDGGIWMRTARRISLNAWTTLFPNLLNMAAVKTMAENRLQSILSHLSPPITVLSSESPPSSSCSASCLTAGLSELGHGGEFWSGKVGAVEDGSLGQSAHLFEVECAGPNSDREAKLLENLMLSRLRRFYTQEKCNPELSLVPCRGDPESQAMAEEHVDVVSLETRDLESFDRGDTQTELDSVEAPEENGTGESNSGLSDGEGEFLQRAEPVRSGITSASAVSSSGAVDGQSLAKVRVEKKSKSLNHLTACEFCDIIQGAAPCFKLYEDELCLCILDINPLSIGHSLILPKSHFPCLEATPPLVAAAMCAAVPLISRALLAATRCDSFNMLVNSGVAAGQVIMHTHFHIIPRCKGDGLWKSESATRKPMRKVQEAKLLAQAVRTKLSPTVGPVTQ